MTALARQPAAAVSSAEATIVGAEIAAGHDGAAEIADVHPLRERRYLARWRSTPTPAFGVMRACGAADLAGLIGRSWRDLAKRLEDLPCTTS